MPEHTSAFPHGQALHEVLETLSYESDVLTRLMNAAGDPVATSRPSQRMMRLRRDLEAAEAAARDRASLCASAADDHAALLETEALAAAVDFATRSAQSLSAVTRRSVARAPGDVADRVRAEAVDRCRVAAEAHEERARGANQQAILAGLRAELAETNERVDAAAQRLGAVTADAAACEAEDALTAMSQYEAHLAKVAAMRAERHEALLSEYQAGLAEIDAKAAEKRRIATASAASRELELQRQLKAWRMQHDATAERCGVVALEAEIKELEVSLGLRSERAPLEARRRFSHGGGGSSTPPSRRAPPSSIAAGSAAPSSSVVQNTTLRA
jgi:hypothetical protein